MRRFIGNPMCKDCGDEIEQDARSPYCDSCNRNYTCECGNDLNREGDRYCASCEMAETEYLHQDDYYGSNKN